MAPTVEFDVAFDVSKSGEAINITVGAVDLTPLGSDPLANRSTPTLDRLNECVTEVLRTVRFPMYLRGSQFHSENQLSLTDSPVRNAWSQNQVLKDARLQYLFDHPPERPRAGFMKELVDAFGARDIKACVVAHPDEAGSLGTDPLPVRWTIQPDGSADDVVVTEPRVKRSALRKCVEAAIRAWRFPKPPYGAASTTQMTHAFDLQHLTGEAKRGGGERER